MAFSGHGEWDPENGFTEVPEGTSITFYSPHGTAISNRDGLDVEQGLNWSPVETFNAGDMIPNYTLSPAPELPRMSDSYVVYGGEMNLSEMLYPDMGPCHWAACRTGPSIYGS
jgi:hypothetical protein